VSISNYVSALFPAVLWKTADAFADAQLFGDAIVTTADNPNILASTILPIAADGTFKRLIEPGLYRFIYGRCLKSIRSDR
jgi:hypothetical protein